VEFPTGVTLVVGANGQGKTTLLEAAAWAATGASFRGAPDAVLVRAGHDAAIVRAEVVEGPRTQLLEAEIRAAGRNRVHLNRHPLARARDRRELVRVTVFAPDDLQLVKGGPSERRSYLDELLVSVAPRYEAVVTDYERVLRQRNALLKQRFGGSPDDETTLQVFDTQLARTGAELAGGRARMIGRLLPMVTAAYDDLAGSRATAVGAAYEAEWWGTPIDAAALASTDAQDVEAALRGALVARRRAELERKVTLTGPHRDEWRLQVRGLDARTHASQGEQRTLALALRLGGHRLCTEITGSAPVLLLDDVFSELDAARSSALVTHLVAGQTLLTTAGEVPPGVRPEHVVRVDSGVVRAAA
jgi:DNA replication and repair protein RecF